MYGLVNKAVQDLVIQNFGENKWLEIKQKAGIELQSFSSMEPYDDKITYQLAGAASEVLNLSVEDILITLGKFWIKYTAEQGYGQMLDLGGYSFPEFLNNLNNMHLRVSMTYDQLKPPSFECIEINETQLKLQYHSHRPGLSSLVIGLLHGLADRFQIEIKVKQTKFQQDAYYDEFLIDYTPVAVH